MTITILPTDLARSNLYSIAQKVHATVEVSDKHTKSREERRKEAEMLMAELEGHIKKPPSKAQLGDLYHRGGKFRLKPESGPAIDYLI